MHSHVHVRKINKFVDASSINCHNFAFYFVQKLSLFEWLPILKDCYYSCMLNNHVKGRCLFSIGFVLAQTTHTLIMMYPLPL